MSLFGTCQRTKSSQKTFEIASRSIWTFLCPALYDYRPPRSRKGPDYTTEKRREVRELRSAPATQEMDNLFVTALVRAGSCREHVKHEKSNGMVFTSTSVFHRTRRKALGIWQTTRSIHSKTVQYVPNGLDQSSAQPVSREELHSLVDIYDTWRGRGVLGEEEDAGEDARIGPEVLSTVWEREGYFTDNRNMTSSESGSYTARVLDEMKRLLDNGQTPDETIFQLYMQLPSPRVSYLSSDLLHALLSQLSVVPMSRLQDAHLDRWMFILADMQSSALPINVALWTTAIRFTGWRKGIDAAFRLWRTMENTHNIKGNHYTLSVLFDLASHNGHFALAEMVERESRARNTRIDRVSRMSRIFYYGVLGDGVGVRRAYAQLVEAGEIVDTAVLSNVIQALIHAGEVSAAEETFSRMKRLHAEKTGATSTPTDWRQGRELKRLLTSAGHRYREKPGEREVFQQAAPINPNWRTYRSFVRYYAVDVGDYHRTEEFLDEMHTSGIDLNTELYKILFEAFQIHGYTRHSEWSLRNLDILWGKFLWSAQEEPWETYFDARLAERIVKAFFKCGGKEKGWWAWEEVSKRWSPAPGAREKIVRVLEGGKSGRPR